MTEHRINPAIKLGMLLGVLWEIFFIGFMLNMPEKRYLPVNATSPFTKPELVNTRFGLEPITLTYEVIPISERIIWAAGLATVLFCVMLLLIYFYPYIRQFAEDLLRKE